MERLLYVLALLYQDTDTTNVLFSWKVFWAFHCVHLRDVLLLRLDYRMRFRRMFSQTVYIYKRIFVNLGDA